MEFNVKNIVILGVSQSGIFELASLVQENANPQEGYKMLGGFFNVFGDRYEIHCEDSDAKKTLSSHQEGAFKKSFGLNSELEIEEFRDYGLKGMTADSSKEEFAQRLAILKEAKGSHIITLTTWELGQIKKVAPELLEEIESFLESSHTVAIDLNDIKTAAASYVLATETGHWVRPKAEAPLSLNEKFTAKSDVLNQFSNEVKLLKSFIKKIPASRVVTSLEVEKGSQATRKVIGTNAQRDAVFAKPRYERSAQSYISNPSDLERISSSLA